MDASPLRPPGSSGRATTSSTSTPAGSSTAHPPVTMEAVLAKHSGSPNPSLSALDQMISERNNLASQNAQLWKLIEKQRAGYTQMIKDLERIRSERDYFKGRVGEMGPLDSPSQRKERSLKPSISASVMNGRDGSPSHSGQPLVRHASSDSSQPPTTITNEAQGDASSRSTREMERSNTVPVSWEPEPNYYPTPSNTSITLQPSQRPQPPVEFPRREEYALQSEPHIDRNVQFRAPQPLVIPPRTQSLASHPDPPQEADISVESSPSMTTKPLVAEKKSSPVSPAAIIAITPATPAQPNMFQVPSESMLSETPVLAMVEAEDIPDPVFQSQPLHTHTQLPATLEVDRAASKAASRESRISLPDEARQFYSNNLDITPTSSPQIPAFASNSSPTPQERGPSPQAPSQTLTPEPPRSTGGSPFLDMTEDDESTSDSENVTIDVVDSPVDPRQRPTLRMDNIQPAQASGVQLSPDQMHSATELGRTPITAPEDFPMPPSSNAPLNGYPPHHVSYVQHYIPSASDSHASSIQSSYPPPHPSSQSLASSQTSFSQGGSSSHSDSMGSAYWSQNQVILSSAHGGLPTHEVFRQLPLLSQDLPMTRIRLSHSEIKLGERGKEVLSFHIVVHPGSKEPYRIEKLYSDVMVLDQRVRQSAGKSIAKKLGTVPDAKLFRDHAPAKIDQRKLALESYLQTLLTLPVKDKTEVIAFFTSDVRHGGHKPVMQRGHKEGYLTKRGKNFGGWKTRYFILQGPVLEYYENRGGSHLGSISITGAQIGRQQRSSNVREADDDNEYRHAFLIIEKSKTNSQQTRHVLCAESDEERDNWVEILVRYVLGSYNEDPNGSVVYGGPAPVPPPQPPQYQNGADLRASTSSNRPPPVRTMSHDDSQLVGMAPVSQPPSDGSYGFPGAQNTDDPGGSPSRGSMVSGGGEYSDSQLASRLLHRAHTPADSVTSAETPPTPSSFPHMSPLDTQTPDLAHQRSNSEMGYYPDSDRSHAHSPSHQGHNQPHSPETPRQRGPPLFTTGFQPSLDTVRASPIAQSPYESLATPSTATLPPADGRTKISGPINGAPIPSGQKFGAAKDSSETLAPASTDRREKTKSRMFWGFGGRNAATPPNEKAPIPTAVRAVFGVTLEESLAVAEIAHLPAIVFRCIQYLEAKHAEQEEGIYRLSGSSAVIKNLKDRFNTEGDIDLLSSDEFWDPHAIAGLLKTFFRDLPASILTRDLHLRFLSVMDFQDSQERVRELTKLISLLPTANYSLLRALTAHIILIVQNANINKMTMRNVGIVFSPTLGIPAGVFSLMLGEFNRVFKVDPDYVDEDSRVIESELSPDLVRRNSRKYADSATDELLGLSGRALRGSSSSHSGSRRKHDEDEDEDEILAHFDSESENGEHETRTAGSSTIHSTTSSGSGEMQDQSYPSQPRPTDEDYTLAQNPTSQLKSRASHLAASRGLNISVGAPAVPVMPGAVKDARRQSRMMGLPASPRPGAFPRSPSATPMNFAQVQPDPSSLHPQQAQVYSYGYPQMQSGYTPQHSLQSYQQPPLSPPHTPK